MPTITRALLLLLCALALATGCAKSGSIGTGSYAPPPGAGYDAPAAQSEPSHGAPIGTAADRGLAGHTPSAPESSPPPSDATVSGEAAPEFERRGLGTSFGESRHSRVVGTRFVRASHEPDVTLALWYDDWSGLQDAAHVHGGTHGPIAQTGFGDALQLSVLDESGHVLPATHIGGRTFAMGTDGQRYLLRIANGSAARWEVVASVDGLDVMDGRPASFGKRGYVVPPFSSIVIDGWRTSEDAVAAFRFGAIADSYAERTGEGRNVGVIGVAFFHERGVDPWHEVHRRETADPFPGRFASPPPGRR